MSRKLATPGTGTQGGEVRSAAGGLTLLVDIVIYRLLGNSSVSSRGFKNPEKVAVLIGSRTNCGVYFD